MPRSDYYNIPVHPPLAGMARVFGYENQPEVTSFLSVNMWPINARSGRLVTAPRPAIVPQTSVGAPANMAARVNGAALGKPLQSMVKAVNGQVYWWNGTAWVAATGSEAGSIETDRTVFAHPFLEQVIIGSSTTEPYVFDYDGGDVELLAATTSEPVPSGLTMFAVFQGALCGAGDSSNPHVLYMSRVSDAGDWDFGVPAADLGGAFFTGGENEGLLNGPITALMPTTSDVLVVSTLEGLVALRGHPRQGGIFDPFAEGIWILGQGAWCKGPDDTAYFMTPKGLMKMDPNPSAVPQEVSLNAIPNELIGLSYDHDDPAVTLEYDSRFNGIHIYVRQTDVTSPQAWWYDLKHGGFHKQEVQFPPHTTIEFPPFITTNKSGVLLFGEGYGGIGRMDRFGEEAMQTRLISGGTPLTETPLVTKGFLNSVEFIFDGDTEVGDGVVRMAVGRDAEDAVGRLRQGLPQITTTIEQLKANDGRYFPRLAGGYFAYDIEQTSGRYGLERINLMVRPAGKNRVPTVARIPSTVTEDTFIIFNPASWTGYVEYTVAAASQTLTDYTHLFDLSNITEPDWWANVRPSGADLRITDESNNELDHDLISFDSAGETGLVAFKFTAPTSTFKIRFWVGNDNAPGKVGYDAYDINWAGFWPDGGGNDRTRNVNHFVLANGAVAGNAAGPIGADATSYEAASFQYGLANTIVPAAIPMTLVGYATNNLTAPDGNGYAIIGLTDDDNAPPPTFINAVDLAEFSSVGPTTWRARARMTSSSGSADQAVTSTGLGLTTPGHLYAGKFTSGTSFDAFIDGGNKASDSGPITIGDDFDLIVVGARPRGIVLEDVASNFYDGDLSLLSVHTAARPDAWIARFQAMLTQNTFYTAGTAWIEP